MQDILQRGVRYLTDSGLETAQYLSNDGEPQPAGAFALVEGKCGRQRLVTYYRQHADLAAANWMGFVFETPTRRASASAAPGVDVASLERINRAAVEVVRGVEAEYLPGMPTLVSGAVGPARDGAPGMTIAEAAEVHASQVAALVTADLITAFSMPSAEEAAGVVLAARSQGLPAVVSFRTGPDGRLPSGQSLRAAIRAVDLATESYAAYFMLNGCHPQHFAASLDGVFARRIRGVRASAAAIASPFTIAEGDPDALAKAYGRLTAALPQLAVFGGCAGTEIRHLRKIVREVAAVSVPA